MKFLKLSRLIIKVQLNKFNIIFLFRKILGKKGAVYLKIFQLMTLNLKLAEYVFQE